MAPRATHTSWLLVLLAYAAPAANSIKVPMTTDTHSYEERKIALFTTLIQTDDHHRAESTNMVSDAAVMICTARHHGSKMPFLMDFANLRDDHVAMLAVLGFQMHNVTDSIGMWQSKYKPCYSKAQAIQENRSWKDQPVQERRDGWATYFKFKAWTYDKYDKILISDTDIIWKDSPDPILAGLGFDIDFDAFPEKEDRARMGLNTHLMIITPSKDRYEQLVDWASSGHYFPYTNTEQDVLESNLDVHEETGNVVKQFHHRHKHVDCAGIDAERLAQFQNCEDIWRACKQRYQGSGRPIWRDGRHGDIIEPLW